MIYENQLIEKFQVEELEKRFEFRAWHPLSQTEPVDPPTQTPV